MESSSAAVSTAILLDTYKAWAHEIKVLDIRYMSLIPWINTFPARGRRWWSDLASNSIGGPFDGVRDRAEELLINQYNPPNDESNKWFFFYSRIEHTDKFVEHWRERAAAYNRANRRARDKPTITDEDRRMLKDMFFDPAVDLVDRMFAVVQGTDAWHTKQVLDRLKTLAERLDRARRTIENTG